MGSQPTNLIYEPQRTGSSGSPRVPTSGGTASSGSTQSPPRSPGGGMLPSLSPVATKRFERSNMQGKGGSLAAEEADGAIRARHPASRTASCGAASGAGTGAGGSAGPDFWTSKEAPICVEASVRSPEVRVQLLTRALEESRAKIAHLQHDRTAVCDALGDLCCAAGAGGDASATATATASMATTLTIGANEEALVPLRLELLSTQLQQLREAVRVREVAVAEAQLQHERTAMQVVAQQQQQEELERQLEEARYSAQQGEQAQHTMQHKIGLLEGQLAASAESARRRMEEQLEAFRGDAEAARVLRDQVAELERRLEGAQRAQCDGVERCRQLEAQLGRAQGRLQDASTKQAELSQQLWDKSAALNNLADQHQALQAASNALATDQLQLQEALAECQQRVQHAEGVVTGLHAQCQAGQHTQAALQKEVEQLRAELQQERQHKHHLQAALAEEQLTGANQRAALQGRQDEIASLLLKLDEYSGRIVAAEGALEAAQQLAAAEGAGRRAADQAAQQVRHEAASLRDSVADLAAAEARLKQQLGEAQAALASATSAQAELEGRCRELEAVGDAAAEEMRLLQATLAEQARQLEQMAALQQQCQGQQQQLAELRGDLRAAGGRQAAVQAAADELAAAKQQADREVHKQKVLTQHLSEQNGKLGADLRAVKRQLEEAHARAEAAAAQAAAQAAAHDAAAAEQRHAHERRRVRNERLEHDNRQQAIVIAELQATCTSLSARLAATKQHNAALHRFAVAHGSAYGRLSAHAAGLHAQLARQLARLLHLCRHLGLQLAAALSAADPMAALEAASSGGSSCSADGVRSTSSGSTGPSARAAAPLPETAAAPLLPHADKAPEAAAVAAAVLCIEGLRTELQVAVQLLEMQTSGSEACRLAEVPAGIAQALAADLADLPHTLLASVRLEHAAAADIASTAPADGASAAQPAVPAAAAAAAAAAAVAACVVPQPGAGQQLPQVQQQQLPQVQQQQLPQVQQQQLPPPSALSAQVAQMEAGLQQLVRSSAEQAARAAAAEQLQEQERLARQCAQELATGLSAKLAAVQSDLAATRAQRDELEATGKRLARELRDAIYSISQLHAQQQGQGVSWAVRGLKSAGVQTQHCELWEANLVGGWSGRGSGRDGTHEGGARDDGSGCQVTSARMSGSIVCVAAQGGNDGACGADGWAVADGSSAAAAAGTTGTGPCCPGSGQAGLEAPARVLPLAALNQQIGDVYRAKAVYDIAVARGQRAFLPLSDFLAAHLVRMHGADGAAAEQHAQQLQASVEAHVAVHEVAMFGLAAGMLEEAAGPDMPGGWWLAGHPAGSSSMAGAGDTAVTAAAVPLVLYNRRRRGRGRNGIASATQQQQQQQQTQEALPSLRRFSAASWHAAYLSSAARPPLSHLFDPRAALAASGSGAELGLLPSLAPEVYSLALSVPGVEQLAGWVLDGGVASCLPQLDLGLRLAENQVPQLYLLAVENCRLLGLPTIPQLFVKSSGEAAAYYLLLPAEARLHGFNGGLAVQAAGAGGEVAEAAPAGSRPVDSSSPRASQASAGCGPSSCSGSLDPGEQQAWQCVLVLTSALVDLLEPEELQAVMAGCLGFQAALVAAAGSASGGALAPEGPWEGGALGSGSGRQGASNPGGSSGSCSSFSAGGQGLVPAAELCRGMAALATLGALCMLGPDVLPARLPPQVAPFFHSRIQPVLRRTLRYLSLFSDRVGVAAAGGVAPVAAAVVKAAAGCATLRNELNLGAVLQQARALGDASAGLLPKALLREDGATVAAAGPSLALLRIRELQQWWRLHLPAAT